MRWTIVVLALCAATLAGQMRASAEEAANGDFAADSRLRQAIRADAERSYAADCGRVVVADRALLPVEITGGGETEYAVAFGRVECPEQGSRWSGTGGVMVQFWVGEGGPPRLLLEHSMHGFTIGDGRLVTYQHGAYCPGGAGPDMCRVIYTWNGRDRRLEVVERRLVSELRVEPEMAVGYDQLSH